LDLYGENIRARAYVTSDPVLGEKMLRPIYTVPVAERWEAIPSCEPWRDASLHDLLGARCSALRNGPSPGSRKGLFKWATSALAKPGRPHP
jgi:hypothetical protein